MFFKVVIQPLTAQLSLKVQFSKMTECSKYLLHGIVIFEFLCTPHSLHIWKCNQCISSWQKKMYHFFFFGFFSTFYFIFLNIVCIIHVIQMKKKTLIKQGNPSDVGRIHLSDGLSIKCVIKKNCLLFISIQWKLVKLQLSMCTKT